MKIDIHHFIHMDDELEQKLDAILTIVKDIQRKEVITAMTLGEIKDKVAAEKTVIDGAQTLLSGLSATIKELAARETVNPTDLQALADQLDANTTELSQAVVDNTPAAPAA